MTIQEILYTHQLFWRQGETVWRCECGKWEDDTCAQEENHRAHVAEVLDKHMQEREAAVIAGLAELLDEYQSSHDIAECAAPVEGETGRQAVIDNWETITEEPAEWLREQSKLHHERGFEHIRYVAYEAWQEGFEAGWKEHESPDAFVNDLWDAKTPNPYADKEATNGSE